MANVNGLEQFETPEQETCWNKLETLKHSFDELVFQKRSNAFDGLLNTDNSSDVKISILDEYFSFRMSPERYTVSQNNEEYALSDLLDTAVLLFEDRPFGGNDAPLVLNNLDFFKESISLDDVILGYHYYRLSETDESLSHLVRMVGYYAQSAFEMDGLKADYQMPDRILSHEESIELMGKILSYVDGYLKEPAANWEKYESSFNYQRESKLDCSSRIDRNASDSIAKTDAAEIRLDKLFEFLSSCEGYDDSFEFRLKYRILPDLRNQYVEDLIHRKSPTFSDLIVLAKEKAQKESSDNSTRYEYRNIYKFLYGLQGCETEYLFNQISPITDADVEEANRINEEIDLQASFDNLKRCMPFIFVVANTAKIIPEFSIDKEAVRGRKRICRKLCEIYKEDDAFETINEDETINAEELIDNERKLDNNKNKLFKSFLLLHESSSIEEIMNERLELLDKAKEIAPEDFGFLDKCSEEILQQVKKATSDNDVALYEKNIRSAFIINREIVLSDDVIHTLATAEFLFSQYVNETYAEQNFDFSCISALYYQAYENAYNELLWSKYARFLNETLTLNGTKYCNAIKACYVRNNQVPPDSPCYGYLPSSASNWKKYGDKYFRTVNGTCMYGPFCKLINGQEYKQEEIPHFYEWLAKELGFDNIGAMMSNRAFVDRLNRFRSDMAAAVGNRNNASHGGSEIDIIQCRNDKMTVLADLQEIRDINLGLVQQLVNLYCFNK